MAKTKTVAEALANIKGSIRTKSEKWITIEANMKYIIEAKRRRASFRLISEALGEAGIEVKPDTLRVFLTKHPRYLEAFPTRTKRASKERKTEKQLQDGNEKQAEPKTEPSTVTASVVSLPPKPIMNPNDFAGIRRLNARK